MFSHLLSVRKSLKYDVKQRYSVRTQR